MGVDRWIDLQLHPERIADTKRPVLRLARELQLERRGASEKYPPPNRLLQRLQAKGRNGLTAADSAEVRQATAGPRKVTVEAQNGRIDRALLSERQLQEVMTDFWLNHFSVYIQKGPPERYQLARLREQGDPPERARKVPRAARGGREESGDALLPRQLGEPGGQQPPEARAAAGGGRARRAGRRGGFGAPLTQQQQQQAARRRGGLNENYGRELLELHTLGVDGGYTQQDVINVARALTGWTFPRPQHGRRGSSSSSSAAMHDAGEKIVLGHRLAAGRGIEDGEDVLDIVARHPSTAKYIAFKLARRFVSDTPPAASSSARPRRSAGPTVTSARSCARS